MNDSRLKYIEVSIAFNNRATEVEMFCKQSQAACEKLALMLVKQKPKTPDEFERNEKWSDFVLKQSKNNEATIELLSYIKGFLADVLEDSKILIDGAILRDKLKDQSELIEMWITENDNRAREEFKRHKANLK